MLVIPQVCLKVVISMDRNYIRKRIMLVASLFIAISLSCMDRPNVDKKTLQIEETCQPVETLEVVGYDFRGVPYARAREFPAVANWFSKEWMPYASTFEHHEKKLIPQFRVRKISLQDITAPYLRDYASNDYSNWIDYMSYEELSVFLNEHCGEYNAIQKQNDEFIQRIASRQNDNRVVLEENKLYSIDMDGDNTPETMVLSSKPHESDTVNRVKEYSLYINDQEIDTFIYTDITLYVLNLGTCNVLELSFSGSNVEGIDSIPKPNNRAYGYWNNKGQLLGLLNGRVVIPLDNGLFVTTGWCESIENNRIPLFSYMHLYCIYKGKLYHLSFPDLNDGWQQSNSIWLLKKALPYYDSVKKENSMIEPGKMILFCGINEKGDMYLISEDNNCGYLKLRFDEMTIENPFVLSSGIRLTEYLDDYDSMAFAG